MIVAGHDKEDLVGLTDRIAVLEAGRISHRGETSAYFEGAVEGDWLRGVIIGADAGQVSVRMGSTVLIVEDVTIHYSVGERVDIRLGSGGVEIRPVAPG